MRSGDRQRARHLLEHRADGFSIIRALRRSVASYLILAAMIGVAVVVGMTTDRADRRNACVLAVGMLCGMFFRDLGWLRRIKRGWPLTERFTDWHAVEAIAAGRDPDDTGSAEGGP